MALLDLCQQAAAAIPVAIPPSIIGNTDQTASLLLACAQEEGMALARRPQSGWAVQQVEYSFTTTAGQNDYPLPADFRGFIDDTLWDRTRFRKLRGPLSPGQWQRLKSSTLGVASWERRWRLRNTQPPGAVPTPLFSLYPAVTDTGATLVFEYLTNAWCLSATGTPQSRWQADTDTGLLDEYLIMLGVKWRVLNRLGLAYAEERDQYDREVDKAVARDGGVPTLSLEPCPARFGALDGLIGPNNIPETGYGA
jgi:hypothetical protein